MLTIGTIVAIAAPVAAVIACGSKDNKRSSEETSKEAIKESQWYRDMLSSGETGWNQFLNDKRNNFDQQFINKATIDGQPFVQGARP